MLGTMIGVIGSLSKLIWSIIILIFSGCMLILELAMIKVLLELPDMEKMGLFKRGKGK